MIKKYYHGSILLIMLLIVMLLIALTAVIISSISAKNKTNVDYLKKAKIYYLAESANAIAKNKLLKAKEAKDLEKVKDKMFEDGIISYQINQFDTHLWQIESIAEDIERTKKIKILNIVIPNYEYLLYANKMLVKSNIDEFSYDGKICIHNLKNYYINKINISCPNNIDFPILNTSYFTSLIPFPGKDIIIINDNNYVLDGGIEKVESKIYIANKNLILKNIKAEASFISLAGNIIVKNNCSITKYKNYPALASLKSDIIFEEKAEPIINGLIFGQNIFIKTSLNVKGAIYAIKEIIIEKNNKSDLIKLNMIFDESIIQTKGLIFNWSFFKNVSWKVIE